MLASGYWSWALRRHIAIGLVSVILPFGCTCPKVGPGPAAKLALVYDPETKDPNGFPVNPVFAGAPSPVEPRNCANYEDCGALAQTLPSRKKDWIPLLCRDSRPGRKNDHAGHWNYSVATFTGRAKWGSYSPDDDYGLTLLVAPSPAGSILTCGSDEGVHVEFRACETVNHFTTSWWTDFREAIKRGQENRTARDFFGADKGLEAVLIGLVGVDMVHCYATELHPVYGFAVMVGGNPGKDERWALFARLVGGEGECAEGSMAPPLENAPRGRLVLPLPWRRDKAGKLLAPPLLGADTALYATRGSDVKEGDDVEVVARPDHGWITVSIPIAPLASGDENAKPWTRVSGELVLRYGPEGSKSLMPAAPPEKARPTTAVDRNVYFKEISSRKDKEERLVASLKKLSERDREKVIEALYQTVARANAGPDDEHPLRVRLLAFGLNEANAAPAESIVAPPVRLIEVPKRPTVKEIPNPWYQDPK